MYERNGNWDQVAAHRQQVDHGLGVHRPGPLDRPAPGEGLPRHRGQHLGAGGVLRRQARRVRRLLGVEAVRRRRPGPHRLDVQQDAVRDHEGLPHLQRAQGLERPRLLGHRLDGHQAQRHLLPLHQGRARPAPPARPARKFITGEKSTEPDRRPRTTSSPTASARARSTAARGRRSSSRTPRTSGTCSSTSSAAAATSPSRPPTSTPASGPRPTNYQLPASPRHGTVLPVTQAEYDRLLAAYPATPASVVDATAKGQKGYAIVTEARVEGRAADAARRPISRGSHRDFARR